MAARLRASMAGDDAGAHRTTPGAWCAFARAGSTTLDSKHGHQARPLNRRQQTGPQLTGLRTDLCARADFIEDKADKQLTAMRADVAGQIAITATELIAELDSSTRSCCRRFTEGKSVQALPITRAQGILGTRVSLHT